MIHTFAAIIELQYDDQDGEFQPPSISQIEQAISNDLWKNTMHLGFEKDYEIEVASGSLEDAFGIEDLDGEDE